MRQMRVVNFERSSQRNRSHKKKMLCIKRSSREKSRKRINGSRIGEFYENCCGGLIQGYLEINTVTSGNLNL